ncbi:MAG: hypothetical protein KGZ25_12890, partial [Planctomycetes bacterium]|nr:hypothetical protein [Planctomycetota bacterium]
LQTPGKVKIQPDGRVGITRVMVRPSENIVRIDHALKDKQKERADRANAMFVFGMEEAPTVEVNDRPLPSDKLEEVRVDGEKAWVVPLEDQIPGIDELRQRFEKADQAFQKELEG